MALLEKGSNMEAFWTVMVLSVIAIIFIIFVRRHDPHKYERSDYPEYWDDPLEDSDFGDYPSD